MQSTATANPVLSGHAEQFMRDQAGYVGLRLFPAFPTAEQSAQYYIWKRENALNVPTNIRHSPGAPFARSLPMISDDNYACRDYGTEQPVPDEVRRKYLNYLDADLSATRRNTDIIKINHELRAHTLATSAAVPNAGVAKKWDDPDSSPKDDVDIAKEAIRKNCGHRPNLMVISESVRLLLSVHPKIADRVKYTVTGITTLELLAAYFEVGEIIVALQVHNTAQEGQALTPADIWADDVIIAHVNPARDLMTPTFGRTFFWSDFGSVGPDSVPIQIVSYRDETVASDIHRARHFTDEKLVFDLCGYRINNVLT